MQTAVIVSSVVLLMSVLSFTLGFKVGKRVTIYEITTQAHNNLLAKATVVSSNSFSDEELN